jgi:hypothetical protein
LSASVTLNLKQGKKDLSLDAIASSMRHLHDVKYEITLPHGEPLKISQTKISRSYSVEMNHDLPLPESIFGQMTTMLDSLVGNGEITPDP